MRYRWQIGFLVFVFILGGLIYGLAPKAIMVVYGRYPEAVPSQLLSWVATPLPAALPAPVVSEPVPTFEVLLVSTATETPLLPTFTPAVVPVGSTSEASAATTQLPPTSTPLPPTPTATPTAVLPTAVRLENIAVIPQKFNNCGPANLSITMAYHGVTMDQLEIGGVVKPNYDDRNVSPHELVDYVNQHTQLAAEAFVGGSLPLLKSLLAAGYPVIIEKGLYPNDWEGWMGHYLTLVGYDDAAQEFISLDTFLGPWDGSGRFDTIDTIEQFWQQFNYTFILIYPPADQPIIDTLVGDMGEPELMWRRAALRAQQQTEDQPDNAFAWFNLGSSLTELGHLTAEPSFYESAAAAFDRARTIGLPWRMLWYQFTLYEAYLGAGRYDEVLQLTDALLTSGGGQNVEETYLYRGRALAALGDETAAQAAFIQAQALNPNVQLTDEVLP